MKSKNLSLAIASALMVAGPAFAMPPGTSEQLAARPMCTVAGNKVYVRGAVAIAGNSAPVPGATVTLAYGHDRRRATTNAAGIYEATFLRGDARVVREISTTLAAPTGTNIPVEALEGTAACNIPAASIGELRQIE